MDRVSEGPFIAGGQIRYQDTRTAEMIRDDQMTPTLVVSFWMASMTTDYSSKQS